MKVVKHPLKHLNLGQTLSGLPLYVIARQIYKQLLDTHGKQTFLILFGGLHVAMTFLKVIRAWLRSVVESLVEAKVASAKLQHG